MPPVVEPQEALKVNNTEVFPSQHKAIFFLVYHEKKERNVNYERFCRAALAAKLRRFCRLTAIRIAVVDADRRPEPALVEGSSTSAPTRPERHLGR